VVGGLRAFSAFEFRLSIGDWSSAFGFHQFSDKAKHAVVSRQQEVSRRVGGGVIHPDILTAGAMTTPCSSAKVTEFVLFIRSIRCFHKIERASERLKIRFRSPEGKLRGRRRVGSSDVAGVRLNSRGAAGFLTATMVAGSGSTEDPADRAGDGSIVQRGKAVVPTVAFRLGAQRASCCVRPVLARPISASTRRPL